MIIYNFEKDLIYKEEMITHLDKYNIAVTGPNEPEIRYIYVFDVDILVGAVKARLAWNWILLDELFYDTKEVLQLLFSKVAAYFEGISEGIKVKSDDIYRLNDLYAIGFYKNGVIQKTTLTKELHHAYLTNFNLVSDSRLKCISQNKAIKQYSDILTRKDCEYRNLHDRDMIELSLTAYDDECFVGGVNAQLFKDSLYINILVVVENYRGHSIGSTLMKKIEDEAINQGVELIYLETVEFQARAFYEKLGYQLIMTRNEQPKGYKCYVLCKKL